MVTIKELIRENLRNLTPYSSARDEYSGKGATYFDANENPFNTGYNRYPDPYQTALKHKIGQIKHIHPKHIFLGNGSDEVIELLFRAFCEPNRDKVLLMPPTYGMYKVSADVNGVEIVEVPLIKEPAKYRIDVENVLKAITPAVKIIYICNPNNPTANLFDYQDIIRIIQSFNGLVIVDEAYIDFANIPSLIEKLDQYPNLIVLQTFSKAWGMAGVRLGMGFAHEEVISILSKIKIPYNINELAQEYALKKLDKVAEKEAMVAQILEERKVLIEELKKLPLVELIYPSDANFLLVQVPKPKDVYKYLTNKKIVVRDRSSIALCEGCLRITVGTPDENKLLINSLKEFTI